MGIKVQVRCVRVRGKGPGQVCKGEGVKVQVRCVRVRGKGPGQVCKGEGQG